MYSILLSTIKSIDLIKNKYGFLLNQKSKVVILPWAFPTEINSKELMNNYFGRDTKRYNRYINELKKFNVKEENFKILDCYTKDKEDLKNNIKQAQVMILPGGNPEMFKYNISKRTGLLHIIKQFNGIIIGESAGTLLHLKEYFLTKKNNYHNRLEFYEGIGILKDEFLLDVHSENGEYSKELYKIANKKRKKVYAIFDNGAIICNRRDMTCELFGEVLLVKNSFKDIEIHSELN